MDRPGDIHFKMRPILTDNMNQAVGSLKHFPVLKFVHENYTQHLEI